MKTITGMLIALLICSISFGAPRAHNRFSTMMKRSATKERAGRKYLHSTLTMVSGINELTADSIIDASTCDTLYFLYEEYIDNGHLYLNVEQQTGNARYQITRRPLRISMIAYSSRCDPDKIKRLLSNRNDADSSVCTGNDGPVIVAFRVITRPVAQVTCRIW